VTREELQRALWDDATYVDFDNGLNVAIRKIREALGDSSHSPRYIHTIPRQGYRFQLHGHEMPSPAAAEAQVPAARERPGRAGIWLLAPGLTIAMLAGVAVLWPRLGIVRPAASPQRLQSVAVLPFVNLIGDPEREYLTDGLTDTLITELAAAGVPRVISRQSSSRYRSSSKGVAEIARELGVEALIEGSLVKTGGHYVVNVQLIDATSDHHRWAGRFERNAIDDITEVGDVARSLVREMGWGAVRTAAKPAATVKPEARDAYLRGVFFWHKRSGDYLKRSLDLFSTAARLQPDYAAAWAGLANVYAVGSPNIATLGLSEAEVVSRGVAAAQEAMRLDESAGEPHAALGRIRMAEWKWHEAERELRRAVQLSPQFATGYQWLGTLLMRLGRCDEALSLVTTGAQLDPLAPIVNDAIASVNVTCGDAERGIAVRRRITELHPDNPQVRHGLAKAYALTGQHDHAIREAREAVRLDPDNCYFRAGLAHVLGHASRRAEAQAILSELAGAPRFNSAYSVCLAGAYSALGETDRMFEALEQAYRERGAYLDLMLSDRWVDPYRRDARYLHLLERIGLVHDERSRQAAMYGPRFDRLSSRNPGS
jgi:TolB-like protein/Flp pilus assembly protein TadD